MSTTITSKDGVGGWHCSLSVTIEFLIRITELLWTGNGIDDEGVKILCDAIRLGTCRLTSLNLTGNGDYQKLRLDFSILLDTFTGNLIRGDGARILSDTICCGSSQLTSLDISGEQYTDVGTDVGMGVGTGVGTDVGTGCGSGCADEKSHKRYGCGMEVGMSMGIERMELLADD